MKIAICIPCYNEELTIKSVIDGFKKYAKQADIYVFDNNSTDNTAKIAKENGAIVIKSPKQGKGNVIKHMFSVIDADAYVLIDGDNTYLAKDFPRMLKAYKKSNCDMLIGDRLSSSYFSENTRPFHNLGNILVKFLVNWLYHKHISDIMTGYRICSKNFCKSINIQSTGFEVETEMTIYAIKNNFKIRSIPIHYQNRPEGSYSKVNTIKDGFKIIKYIIKSKIS